MGTVDMTTLRRFTAEDLFHFNNVNLDHLTETYNIPFYMQYLSRWPNLCLVAEAPGGEIMGYHLGKVEGRGTDWSGSSPLPWHGHVTAVTVAPEYRRLGIAAKFMEDLEVKSEKVNGWFVDLFVRVSNNVAVAMYTKLGYSIYRQIYAYDMRKALPRDKDKKSAIPLPHPVYPDDLD